MRLVGNDIEWSHYCITLKRLRKNGDSLMHFDSIKSRLVLMTLICVIGMALLMGSQHYFTQELVNLNKQRDTLLRLSNDLLQMRRHEKDFLLRFRFDYVSRFQERADAFNGRLSYFTTMIGDYELAENAIGDLASAMEAYQNGFQEVVNLHSDIGLNESEGLRGDLTHIVDALSHSSRFTYDSDAQQELLKTQVAQKAFYITRDLRYRENFMQSVLALTDTFPSSSDGQIHLLLKDYEAKFMQLSFAIERLGITHNDGLRGQFRQQAHDVESQLNRIDSALQPLIEEQEQQVQTYSLMIALLTSVALVLLLVKSFATFHRAFSNFVMFFYRCKRQYQKIDTRQLGFAEFKSLAELANEMVESRQAIEERLAATEAKLTKLQKQNNDLDEVAK